MNTAITSGFVPGAGRAAMRSLVATAIANAIASPSYELGEVFECPGCGPITEVNPVAERLFVRAYKVDNYWHQCLICAGHYDKDLNPHPSGQVQFPDKGWFWQTREGR